MRSFLGALSVFRAWGRAAVAMVVALAAAFVIVPVAQAKVLYEIAFEGANGNLWSVPHGGAGQDLSFGMGTPGTSPSINQGGRIAFQANTHSLWWTTARRDHFDDLRVAMMAGTNPSINDTDEIAFQAINGDLFTWAPPSVITDTEHPMKAGTSPSLNNHDKIAFQGRNGDLWILGPNINLDTRLAMMAGTSPSLNNEGEIAFQGSNGDLWKANADTGVGRDTALLMTAGTSPSINDKGEIAFQRNDKLWTRKPLPGGGNVARSSGLAMMAGTSPSLNNEGEIAFQANTGDLWTAGPNGRGNLNLKMSPGTSPSISPPLP